MTHEQLLSLMREPHRLRAEDVPALATLVEAYPYASSLIFLYLYALALTQDVRYPSELRRLSIYLPRREELYRRVEGRALDVVPQGTEASGRSSSEEDDPFAMIDRFLSEARASGADLPEDLGYGAADRGDYFAHIATEERQRIEDEPLGGLLPPEGAPTKPSPQSASSPRATQGDPIDEPIEPVSEDLFSETLARIYIQQGHYDKALRIIRHLSLNYPKKNRYFADQIRFLERLIDSQIDNK